MRALRVHILKELDGQPDDRVILVTSTLPNEGKTTTSLNLALSLAQNGASVILVDADLRNQTVKQALREAIDAIPQILTDPEPVIWLSEYQSSSIQYLVRVWAPTDDYWNVYYTLMEEVRESFGRHGVEMTYDHLNVHLVEDCRTSGQ